jgi:hypothetical protein
MKEPTMEQHKKWMTINEAAEALNSTPLNVLMHVKRGLIHGLEHEHQWFVERQDVETIVAKNEGRKMNAIFSGQCGKHKQCSGCD